VFSANEVTPIFAKLKTIAGTIVKTRGLEPQTTYFEVVSTNEVCFDYAKLYSIQMPEQTIKVFFRALTS
jgi:hypothetical protein